MKTTNYKDSVKVNQILPIMQEHFGKSMNLARIKLMELLIHALCVFQTVSLHKLAAAMPADAKRDSNMRRLQRFLSQYALNLDLMARMIFSLLPVRDKLVLSMDRTNWKFGDFNINILMLGFTYKGIAFPLAFSLMPKRGNSKWTERKELVERFGRLFGYECVDCLVADREFIGKEWIGWLNSMRIRYYIRIRQNFWIVRPATASGYAHGGSSMTSGSDRRSSTTNSSSTRGSMSIWPEAGSRTPTGFQNCRSSFVSTVPRMLS